MSVSRYTENETVVPEGCLDDGLHFEQCKQDHCLSATVGNTLGLSNEGGCLEQQCWAKAPQASSKKPTASHQ